MLLRCVVDNTCNNTKDEIQDKQKHAFFMSPFLNPYIKKENGRKTS